jgi:hypothetical protein
MGSKVDGLVVQETGEGLLGRRGGGCGRNDYVVERHSRRRCRATSRQKNQGITDMEGAIHLDPWTSGEAADPGMTTGPGTRNFQVGPTRERYSYLP